MAAFIKFDGLDGESTDAKHEKWSDLESVTQVIHRPGGGASGARRNRGDVVLEDIHVVKHIDVSSPQLAESVCKGKTFSKVEIHITTTNTDSSRETFFAYELKNVLVTSYQVTGAAQDKCQENISLNFDEIKTQYTKVTSDGKKADNKSYTWKVEAGKG